MNKKICTGDIYVSTNDYQFDGNMLYFIEDAKGYVKLTGLLNTNGEVKNVSRIIYFKYKKSGNQFMMISNQIERTRTDNVDDIELEKSFPAFYVYTGKYFSVRIDPTTNAKIFYTSKLPSLFCKNI